MSAAGIAVSIGVGAAQVGHDHIGHILRVTAGRPCVTLKLADTADGFASAGANDSRLRITGQIADLRVQIMRSTHEAIMVGIETALIDDPALTVRLPASTASPCASSSTPICGLPERSRLAATAGEFRPWSSRAPKRRTKPARRLEDLGVMIERVPLDAEAHVDLHHALGALSVRGITRVFSEGGPRSRPGSSRLASPTRSRSSRPTNRLADPACRAHPRRPRGAASTNPVIAPVETLDYGPDTMRLWQRVGGPGRS